MAVRDFQLGSVANSIVIRGFGNGGHGGDLGAVIDGIPLNEAMSHADGYVDLNVVIPLEIDSFTVFKGPVSALYGNYNRGGLVNIQTRKSGDYAELDVAGGSFDTIDLQGAYGSHFGETQQLNLAAQTFRSDGFRPQSDTKRSALAGRWSGNALPELQLALSTRYLKSESDSASYLTQQQFQSNRRGVDPRVNGDGGDKEFLTVRGDANYEINKDLKLLTLCLHDPAGLHPLVHTPDLGSDVAATRRDVRSRSVRRGHEPQWRDVTRFDAHQLRRRRRDVPGVDGLRFLRRPQPSRPHGASPGGSHDRAQQRLGIHRDPGRRASARPAVHRPARRSFQRRLRAPRAGDGQRSVRRPERREPRQPEARHSLEPRAGLHAASELVGRLCARQRLREVRDRRPAARRERVPADGGGRPLRAVQHAGFRRRRVSAHVHRGSAHGVARYLRKPSARRCARASKRT